MPCKNCSPENIQPGKIIRVKPDDMSVCADCGMPLRPHPISSDAIHRKWPLYETRVHDRLIIGAEAYGDSSFSMAPDKLLANIAEELLDICGWSFILWCRIADLQQQLKEREESNATR